MRADVTCEVRERRTNGRPCGWVHGDVGDHDGGASRGDGGGEGLVPVFVRSFRVLREGGDFKIKNKKNHRRRCVRAWLTLFSHLVAMKTASKQTE